MLENIYLSNYTMGSISHKCNNSQSLLILSFRSSFFSIKDYELNEDDPKLEQVRPLLTDNFFKRCSYILCSMFAQMQLVGQMSPPTKELVDQLTFLSTVDFSKEDIMTHLSSSMMKLKLWVSFDDQKQLLTLLDPFNSGYYRFNIIVDFLKDYQSVITGFISQTQFTVCNYFHASMVAHESQLVKQKKAFASYLEKYAATNGFNPDEGFRSFDVL